MEDKRLQWVGVDRLKRIIELQPNTTVLDIYNISRDYENLSCVYLIINPKGKCYVGSTINLKYRLETYRRKHCKKQPKLYNSIEKYGINNHEFYIIETTDTKNIYNKELDWGIFYNVLDNGLNCRLPKIDDVKLCVSDDTREKISLIHKGKKLSEERKKEIGDFHRGKKLSEEHIDKIKIVNTGKKRTQEHKNKISENNKLRVISNETRNKISNAQKGRKHSDEHRKKVSDNNAKNMSKIVFDTLTGIFYNSVKELSDITGLKHSTMRAKLNGSLKNNTQYIYA